MTAEEYAALQTAITAAVVAYVGKLGTFFLPPILTLRDWMGLLELLWPAVKQSRDEASSLARTFYDLQRKEAYPTMPNLAQNLEPYEFEWFIQDMEPVRQKMQQEQATPKTLDLVQLAVARAVENGGRRQIIHAIEADEMLDEPTESDQLTADSFDKMMDELEAKFNVRKPERKDAGDELVRGWARVATGRETCAWCLMLVSRGPVYSSARSAGLNLSDSVALDRIVNDETVNNSMNDWHIGCDCKVVPVFKNKSWVGAEAAKNALDMWIDAGLKASEELSANPEKKYYSFKEKRWKKTTTNRETINQLRKMIENGEINSSDWAALRVA